MTIAERLHAALAALAGHQAASDQAVTAAQTAQKSAEAERDTAVAAQQAAETKTATVQSELDALTAQYQALEASVGDVTQLASDISALEQLAGTAAQS